MEYKIIKSKRRTISLSINDELEIIVRAPYFATQHQIEKFVLDNTLWIEKAKVKKQAQIEKNTFSEEETKEMIKLAKEIIPEKVSYYSRLMNLYPTGIKITSAKKRFGSCSSKNSLCFSYILMNYPEDAIDYVVVHELAHIKVKNHQKEFYALVSKYLPDYKEREKLLKN